MCICPTATFMRSEIQTSSVTQSVCVRARSLINYVRTKQTLHSSSCEDNYCAKQTHGAMHMSHTVNNVLYTSCRPVLVCLISFLRFTDNGSVWLLVCYCVYNFANREPVSDVTAQIAKMCSKEI